MNEDVIAKVIVLTNNVIAADSAESDLITSETDTLLEYLLSEFKDPSEYQITSEIVKQLFAEYKNIELTDDTIKQAPYGAIPLLVMRYILGVKKCKMHTPKMKNWAGFVNRYIGCLVAIILK